MTLVMRRGMEKLMLVVMMKMMVGGRMWVRSAGGSEGRRMVRVLKVRIISSGSMITRISINTPVGGVGVGIGVGVSIGVEIGVVGMIGIGGTCTCTRTCTRTFTCICTGTDAEPRS